MERLITAKRPREISDKVNEHGTIAVYDLITNAVVTGKTYVYLDFPLSTKSKQNFLDRGYCVEDLGNIAIQKDDLYHKVSW